jgi:DNA-binding response OmpR family regulator
MGLLSRADIPNGRILVVEEDEGARELIVSSLRADGHDVDASSTDREARRLLGLQWYDLVVSDLAMPGLDGPSLYTTVSERWPAGGPHVLFVSGPSSTAPFEGFLKAIRAPVLTKPFKPGTLRRTIKRLLS